jgi:acyl-[acyl-carrier-protein]-phospholipid O-acyltransferase/long-chain-fatty-acid--[acyl-carrier-protein] ligase
VAGVVLNAALTVDGRIAVNLNYTVSSEVMNICIRRCGIRRVLTSRRVLERFDLKMDAEVVCLEDLKDQFTLVDKLVAASQAWFWPMGLLERRLGLTKIHPQDTLTVIFTSGSTGNPKGVVLTHNNVGANIEAFNAMINLRNDDVVVGVLPFFHSFGYTTTLWTALVMDAKGVYHYSPLEYRQVGAICHKYRGTVMVSTATFLRTYLRRCPPEDFASLEVLITGAEKLPMDLADAFEKKFGVRPQEGYGTTELSPAVAFNVTPARRLPGQPLINKRGTIGKPIPGVFAKVVDLDTGEDLGPNRPGMLLVSGHCVMKGYFNEPEKTAEVMRGQWYVTGDLALIDEEGYIQITGRQSRFSKIGGEMVPHLHIEEVLMNLLGIENDELRLAVTSVPDPRKGERIVVFHTGLERSPEQLCREMAAAGMPPLWVPSADSFCQVESIPVLGTGKLDLRQLKFLAEERFSVPG